MLHELPIRNAHLLACHEDWHRMTPTEQGRHCQSCQRDVVDFTGADAAALAAARAASADGRVCGRFRPEQMGAVVELRGRQRWFLAAAVLILLQGLSACEVREQLPAVPAGLGQHASPVVARPDSASTAAERYWEDRAVVGFVAEPMPEFPGGQEAMLEFLRTTIRYPDTEGKVFVNFTLDGRGAVHHAQVLKSLHPLLDAEALRAVRLMPRWKMPAGSTPATSIGYTLPITFIRSADSPPSPTP